MTMTKFSRINKQREEITMRVLEDMEKGGNEWKKPWVEASPLPPHNIGACTPTFRASRKTERRLPTKVPRRSSPGSAPSKRTASGDATVKAITENMNSSSCRVASIRTPNATATSRYSTSHLSRASRRFPGIAGDRLHHRPLRAGSRTSGSRQGDRAEARYARKDGTGRPRRPQSLAQEGNGSRRVCPHAGRPRRPCEHAR